MTTLQLSFILVASIWAAVNTVIAGYNAVNATRDRILTGCTDEGVPMSLEHRRLSLYNDWVPLKLGLSLVSLAFAGFLVFLPTLADDVGGLRAVCYIAAAVPMFSFLGFFFLGIGDFLAMRRILAESELAQKPKPVRRKVIRKKVVKRK